MTTDYLTDVGATKGATATERAEWGLASLMIGVVLILAAPVALIFNVVFWRSGPSGVPKVPAFVGAVLGLLVILGLAGFGIAAGLKGRHRAPDDSRPSPLATAGVVTGAAAMILWLVVGIDLLAILSSFMG
jgi:hypothetical protein